MLLTERPFSLSGAIPAQRRRGNSKKDVGERRPAQLHFSRNHCARGLKVPAVQIIRLTCLRRPRPPRARRFIVGLAITNTMGSPQTYGERRRPLTFDLRPCVSLFYVNDIGSTGSRGRTWGFPVYTLGLNSDAGYAVSSYLTLDLRRGYEAPATLDLRCICMFITVGPKKKLKAGGGGGNVPIG